MNANRCYVTSKIHAHSRSQPDLDLDLNLALILIVLFRLLRGPNTATLKLPQPLVYFQQLLAEGPTSALG